MKYFSSFKVSKSTSFPQYWSSLPVRLSLPVSPVCNMRILRRCWEKGTWRRGRRVSFISICFMNAKSGLWPFWCLNVVIGFSRTNFSLLFFKGLTEMRSYIALLHSCSRKGRDYIYTSTYISCAEMPRKGWRFRINCLLRCFIFIMR